MGERGGPFTPIPRVIGEMGRTPVPVAESTRQLGQGIFTPGKRPEEERLGWGAMPSGPVQGQSEPAIEGQGAQGGGELEWALPAPSEPHQPPTKDVASGELPSQEAKDQGGKPPPSEYPLTEQRLVEANKRRKKRLVMLARHHIIKFREERQRMAGEWLEEYTARAASAKLRGMSLGNL